LKFSALKQLANLYYAPFVARVDLSPTF
ncbi:MAG: hypothetical protein RLZZ499_1327, partial [Cyanobacteriota bacterium]